MKNKLREIRKQQGYNQCSLSEVIGVTQQTLSSWETGRTLPKPHQMQHLQDVLKVSKEKIFFEAFNYRDKE